MFKVNNKDTRTYFTCCSSVSIANFEYVNAGWVVSSSLYFFQALIESKFFAPRNI